MANWTKENIPHLSGKVFIVTGANSGIGYETSLALAEKGAVVVMACRNPEGAQRALDAIKSEVPNANAEVIDLDLASLSSIKAFATNFKSKHDTLDVLINNGGIMGAVRSVTEDGFEAQFGVNHLGHFALTGLLLDMLMSTPSSRIVTVSSRMHTEGNIDWDDIMSEQSYDRWRAYRQSKLAQLLFAFGLGRKLEAIGSQTRSIAVHPGVSATNWAQNNFDGVMGFLLGKMSNAFFQSAAMGALPSLYAAVDSDAKSGSYYGPEHDKKGYPVEVQPSDAAYDEVDANRLWEMSANLTGVNYTQLTV